MGKVHEAAMAGDLRTLRELVKENPALVNDRDHRGQTSLHQAAYWSGSKKIVGFLLTQGADVNAKSASGTTPLHVAVLRGHRAVTKLLMARGAEVNARDNGGFTPLHYVDKKRIAALLLKAGADANARSNDGQTPVHRTLMQGHTNVADTIMKYGGRPH